MRPRSGPRWGASQVPAGTPRREPRGTRAAKQSESEIGRAVGGRGPAGAAAAGLALNCPRAGDQSVGTAAAPGPGWLPAGRQERGSGSGSQGGEGPPPPLGCIRREGRVGTKEEFVHSGLLVT